MPMSPRSCWPGRSAATSPRRRPCGSGSYPKSPPCASSARATSRARAPRWRCCPCGNAPPPRPCWRRCITSSSPTVPISTTASSTDSPSPEPLQRIAVVACGAIARHVAEVAERRSWPVDVHPLPPLLHNRPDRIAAEVERALTRLRPRYARVAVGYADCGTYGGLDDVCARHEVRRLPGAHCYDVFAGAERFRALLAAEPGTYVLTDYLVTSFHR